MTLREVLLLIVAPLATSLIVGVLIAGRGRGAHAALHARAWALALGAGAIVGVLGAYGFDAVWPKRAEHWLLWIALGAGIAGAVDALPACQWWVRWPMRVGVSVAAFAVILKPMIDNQWSSPEAAAHVIGYTVAACGLWFALAGNAAQNNDAPRAWIMILLIAAVAGLQLVAGSSIVMAQLTGAVACAALPLLLMAWWTRTWSGANGGVGPMVLLIGSLLLIGVHYGDMQPLHAALAALAVLPASPMMRDGRIFRMNTAARFTFAALLVGTPLLFQAIAYWTASKSLFDLGY